MKVILKSLSIVICICALAACSSRDWQIRANPTELAVAAALDEQPDPAIVSEVELHEFTNAGMPKAVRPCCAFGTAQKVTVASIPVPFYRLANTVSLEDIGPHAYEAGTFSHQKGTPTGRRGGENNGIIYTQLGGFIDLAHVRDTADNAVALFYQIYSQLGQEARIELPVEIGPRYIQLSAFETNHLSIKQRQEVAANIAARLAYFVAEAHEVAQWHGYRTWLPWSEEVSAYSPEDLYSNMLGAKIATALLSNNLTMNRELYNQHMTSWLHATLAWLRPVSKAQTNALFDAIDGHWWDSSEALPSKYMLLLRHYELGDEQAPYLIGKELIEQSSHGELLSALPNMSDSPKSLSLPSIIHDIEIDKVAQQWLFVGDKHKASFKHVPEALWINGFTSESFKEIAKYDAQIDRAELDAHQRGSK
ncbi:DUF4056 domain-containing protein [Shewanella eurypsychrophilus]|uniref:DUF4056 domain-containing protein n=1 Tax=Shewanella eurypsychrophilus TaxID=2593656 RepID=A0ABX6VD35_9GAMM|nr:MULTISPECIES: DUF4056 domain-containing protein [Shewanella]QFU24715.1 DUF4056 domain-containing protein [Shewanella sp. YLB-09]QPG59908.1 DUF4056 domain-containing protein [Shewanella eurypsychrophilus]